MATQWAPEPPVSVLTAPHLSCHTPQIQPGVALGNAEGNEGTKGI